MTILSLSRMGTDLRQADKASFFVPGTVDMVGRRCWAAQPCCDNGGLSAL
jgi:hypothetical protein